jgi:beta-glucosidase
LTVAGRGSAERLEELLRSLSLEEKASLTAGEDLWSLPAVERVGISKLRVTDGPNGARGPSLPGQEAAPTTCVPCGSALGATWDPELVRAVGEVLGEEARAKGCRMLLAPTVNIPRSPLAGRNFECYSEDPLLSGALAAAFVTGVQSRGVAATVKHFVANDAETDRMTKSSEVDERTLRELYLLPFELAVRDGGALAVMTGYNRVNGRWCSEHAELLDVLRDDWGFTGLVCTDWFSVASTGGSSAAGLDLEMPGPGRAFGPALGRAVTEGRVPAATLDAQVKRILSVLDRVGLLDDPGRADQVPERPAAERRSSVARRASAGSIVLCKNEGVLPLGSDVRRVALIGEPAGHLTLMGGGSAAVRADPTVTLIEALSEQMGHEVEIVHEPGVRLARATPVLGIPMSLEFFSGPSTDGDAVHSTERPSAEAMFFGTPAAGLEGEFSVRASGVFVSDSSGTHRFTMSEVGSARLLVGGRVLLDGWRQARPRGTTFMGFGSEEIGATLDLAAGEPVEVIVEYRTGPSPHLSGFRIGCARPDPDDLASRAAEAAAQADVAIVVLGTTHEWESEGFDRETLALPGGQEDLVAAVVERNPRTVVVVNAGAPVDMAWADRVPAVLLAWFGGQEMAHALADVLTGRADPGGRLPVTVPTSLQLTPAYGNFPGEGPSIRYGEGLLVGYRWYATRSLPTRFAFGHGLSYTDFSLGTPKLSGERWSPGDEIELSLTVTNTGSRPGQEVVQCYVEPPNAGASGPAKAFRPTRELKAFAKVSLEAGQSADVTLRLDGRSFARWDPGDRGSAELQSRLAIPQPARAQDRQDAPAGWRVDPGTYILHLGRSSDDTSWRVPIEADEAFLGR